MKRVQQLRKRLFSNRAKFAAMDESDLRYFIQNFGFFYLGCGCARLVFSDARRAYKLSYGNEFQNNSEFANWQIIKNTPFAEFFTAVYSETASEVLEVELAQGITLNAYYETLPQHDKAKYYDVFDKLSEIETSLRYNFNLWLTDIGGENVVINQQTGKIKIVDYAL
jgi:hypothetical protein